jgi:hypothetical protein
VRRAMSDNLAEVSVGYVYSPLNGPGVWRSGGPACGERAAPTGEGVPVGAGPAPRFVIAAESGDGIARLQADFPDLLDAHVRPPLAAGAMWLLRPDGYVACVARAGESETFARYLRSL